MYALSLQCDFWMILQLYCRFFHSPVSFDFPGDGGFSFLFFVSATLRPLKLIWGEASYSIAFFGLGVTLTSSYFQMVVQYGASKLWRPKMTPSEAWCAHAWQSQLFTPGHFDEETDFNYGIDFFVAFYFETLRSNTAYLCTIWPKSPNYRWFRIAALAAAVSKWDLLDLIWTVASLAVSLSL